MQVPARVMDRTGTLISVEFLRPGGGCRHCGACGDISLFPMSDKVSAVIQSDDFSIATGDILLLSAPDRYYYAALFLTFIAPLIAMLGAAVLAAPLGEPASVAAGGIALLAWLFPVLKFANRFFSGIFSVAMKLDNTVCPAGGPLAPPA
ncbi:MAG: SoxR reducing system RseC family protein [Candidatus Wallbacteria bacterium]|nr:SoxR reducing system RseC family protein [Candidatus Wallbacteria bacterium]